MNKGFLTTVFCLFFYCVSAQCTISPFIQQNYELDAKILVLREIQSNENDPDYDNPYIPQSRVDYHLEKLSAIYQNPDNNPRIDSLFNEFQFHVNREYSPVFISYKKIGFTVPTSVSWVQTFIDTGVSGVAALDDFMAQYQFSYLEHYSSNSSGNSHFTLITNDNALNIFALSDDLANVQDITQVYEFPADIEERINYTGVQYFIDNFPFQGYAVEACDIRINDEQNYEFILFGGDCFAGCGVSEYRYVSISDDCSEITFSTTLSTPETELSNVVMYPNPTSSVLNIEGITAIKAIELYSTLGKQISISPNDFTRIDVSHLKNGVYFLKIIDNQNRAVIKKFIKQ